MSQCPATHVHEEDDGRSRRLRCERPTKERRPPFHDGPHRAEYAPAGYSQDGTPYARVVSWG